MVMGDSVNLARVATMAIGGDPTPDQWKKDGSIRKDCLLSVHWICVSDSCICRLREMDFIIS